MDEEIHHVIRKYVRTGNVIVERKAQVRNWTSPANPGRPGRVEALPGEIFDLNVPIGNDIRHIVEMPACMERIAVRYQIRNHQQDGQNPESPVE